VCAAIQFDNQLILGARHFDLLMHDTIRKLGISHREPHTQGFIDQRGAFLNRKEALQVAKEAGQIIKKHGPDDILFSEDIY
jgi:hypothetical protein